MKNTYIGTYQSISRSEIENLTTLVKETLFVENNLTRTKPFTSADLWNVQRQGRSRSTRRYI